MVPTRIWLSFRDSLICVKTEGLELVYDLASATRTKLPRSLCDVDTSDITLHVAEHAEALSSYSSLAEHAEQLSRCADPGTPLIVKVKGIPPRIMLSLKGQKISVQTKGLERVDDLARAAKNNFSRSLCDVDTSDITLHVAEHAEALSSDSHLAEHAEQLSRCADPGTPLIVKVPVSWNVLEDLVRFWKALPEATLATHGEIEYLDLKETYILGDKELGTRLLVRPIYKELCTHFERNRSTKFRWVVTGTPGIGKTFFSAYYLWIAACNKKTVVWQPFITKGSAVLTYLMTQDGVERLSEYSHKLLKAHADSETIYIHRGWPSSIPVESLDSPRYLSTGRPLQTPSQE